ncbi:MAG: hypothetical protein M3N16_00395 [Actinomycetota bacterium]|nr:hypothetical protein [Actinomycetota bacterium]
MADEAGGGHGAPSERRDDLRGTARAREAWESWRTGRRYGYPRCCVARFCWDTLLGQPPASTRFAEVGAFVWREPQPFIVCGMRHRGSSTLPLGRRLVAILAHQARYLRPGAGGAAYRRRTRAGALRALPRAAVPPLVDWADDATYLRWLTGSELDPELAWE